MDTQTQTCVYCKKPIPFEHRCRTVSCDFCSNALLQFMKVVISSDQQRYGARMVPSLVVADAKQHLLAYLGDI